VALIALAAGLVSLGLVQSESWGWADVRTIASMLGGLGVLDVFVSH
jgi:hypothetical protein